MSAAGLTYDTGALIAAERDDRLMWALHRAAIGRGLPPTVPAGVLSEAWRGGPQHRLSRLLKGCRVEELSEKQARQVGGLIARSASMRPKERYVATMPLSRRIGRTSHRSPTRSENRIPMHDV